jgi:large subunit ribosomal protein L17
MRKKIFGRRFKRDINERKALFRSLMHSLVLYGKLKTSEAKAKAIKGEIEKLVTHAKNEGTAARSTILSRLANEKVAEKLISEVAPLFKNRPGGYTRILKLGPRVKDGARMVQLTWVEEVKATSFGSEKRNKSKKKAAGSAKEQKKEVKTAPKTSRKTKK